MFSFYHVGKIGYVCQKKEEKKKEKNAMNMYGTGLYSMFEEKQMVESESSKIYTH